MDFSNNIGSLSIFSSRAGQGKSFAMLYHALKTGRDFTYISGEETESNCIRRISALSKTYKNLIIPHITFKHLPEPKYVREYINKIYSIDIYIDSPQYFYNNPFEAFDLMCGKNIYVSQQLAYHFNSESNVTDENQQLFSTNNLLKKYLVYKEGQIINVKGSEEYQLDLDLIQTSFF